MLTDKGRETNRGIERSYVMRIIEEVALAKHPECPDLELFTRFVSEAHKLRVINRLFVDKGGPCRSRHIWNHLGKARSNNIGRKGM